MAKSSAFFVFSSALKLSFFFSGNDNKSLEDFPPGPAGKVPLAKKEYAEAEMGLHFSTFFQVQT